MGNIFYELLQVGMGRRNALSHALSEKEWKAVFRLSEKQALIGVCCDAVNRLPKEQMPPKMVAINLLVNTRQIEINNKTLNERCAMLTEKLRSDGFRSCILKGQGIARLYPNPLHRLCGDIDVWLCEQAKAPTDEASMDALIRRTDAYARNINKELDGCYHHIGTNIALQRNDDGTISAQASSSLQDAVELHFRPSWMFAPMRNRRLQRWFREQMTMQCKGAENKTDAETPTFNSPSTEFNMVFILLHIFRHIFDEGIGMRQLMDFYYVLMDFNRQTANNPQLREEIIKLWRRFGLLDFAAGTMWVLQKIFGIEDHEMPVKKNERLGRFILADVNRGGSFGHFDKALDIPVNETPWHKFMRKQKRAVGLLRYFPSEVFWQPLFRINQRRMRVHYGWVESFTTN